MFFLPEPWAIGELVQKLVQSGHAGVPHAPAHALPAHADTFAQRATAAVAHRV